MNKTVNQKAWFLILPVLVLVAFSAVIPLMTVVNYSVQDTFGNNQFFWAGLEWFETMLASERMWDALGRQVAFTVIILAIQIPLGVFVALNMPTKGFWASLCLVLMIYPPLQLTREAHWDDNPGPAATNPHEHPHGTEKKLTSLGTE